MGLLSKLKLDAGTRDSGQASDALVWAWTDLNICSGMPAPMRDALPGKMLDTIAAET